MLNINKVLDICCNNSKKNNINFTCHLHHLGKLKVDIDYIGEEVFVHNHKRKKMLKEI